MASIQEPKADDERDFIVVFTVKPGTRLPGDGEIQLNFPEDTGRVTTVILKNLLEFDPSGTPIPIGLKLDVKVRAKNIDRAPRMRTEKGLEQLFGSRITAGGLVRNFIRL
jgi:hypothetical protein